MQGLNIGIIKPLEDIREHEREVWQMKKSLLVRMAIMFLAISTLSGCIWVPYDEGGRRGGGYQERDHEDHRGDRREGSGERR